MCNLNTISLCNEFVTMKSLIQKRMTEYGNIKKKKKERVFEEQKITCRERGSTKKEFVM